MIRAACRSVIFAFGQATRRTQEHPGSANNKPLSLLQLEYLDTGLFEAASVIGVIIFALSFGAALLARALSLRSGLGRFERS